MLRSRKVEKCKNIKNVEKTSINHQSILIGFNEIYDESCQLEYESSRCILRRLSDYFSKVLSNDQSNN